MSYSFTLQNDSIRENFLEKVLSDQISCDTIELRHRRKGI